MFETCGVDWLYMAVPLSAIVSAGMYLWFWFSSVKLIFLPVWCMQSILFCLRCLIFSAFSHYFPLSLTLCYTHLCRFLQDLPAQRQAKQYQARALCTTLCMSSWTVQCPPFRVQPMTPYSCCTMPSLTGNPCTTQCLHPNSIINWCRMHTLI